MAGSNLNAGSSSRVWQLILDCIGYKSGGPSQTRRLFVKEGIPASNTANDAPDQKGDFCYDSTNQEAYICTAYTNTTTFTWTKIS